MNAYPQGLTPEMLYTAVRHGMALTAWDEIFYDGAGSRSCVELRQDPATGEPLGAQLHIESSEYRGVPYAVTTPAFCLAPKLPV